MKISAYYRSNKQLTAIYSLLHLIALMSFSYCAPVNAYDLTKNIQIHGFASQAYIYTTDNNFFGETSNDGDFDFTEIGLNASARLTSRLQLAGQILSRRAGEGDDGDIRLDYGLLDYSIFSGTDGRGGIRLGRILNPLGFYNETRDMPFTRPSIFLPQSIYFDRTRDLALSSDGAHVYGEYRKGPNELFWQFGAAYPRVDSDELERALLGTLQPGDLDHDLSYLGRVLWEVDGGRIRIALSAADVNIDYDPGSVDPFMDGSIEFQPVILSGQYNTEKWSMTAEYARRKFDYGGIHPLIDRSFTGESGYLQLVYRLARNWDAILRYDVLYTDRDDKSGRDFESLTGLPAYTRFAKDWTIGLGWNVTPALLIRAEYHMVDGTAWLPAEDNPNPFDLDKHWDMFAIQVSLRF